MEVEIQEFEEVSQLLSSIEESDSEESGTWCGLGYRTLCLVIIGALGSYAGAMAISVYMFFCDEELELTQLQIGEALAAFQLGNLFGNPFWGRCSDAVGRRTVLVVCFAWTSVCFGLTSLTVSLPQFVVARSAAGTAAVTPTVLLAAIGDLSSDESRPGMLGAFGLGSGVGFMLGAMTSMLVQTLGASHRAVFLIAAICNAVASVVTLRGLPETLPPRRRKPLCGKNRCFELEGLDEESIKVLVSTIPNVGLCFIWTARLFSAFVGMAFFATYANLLRDAFGWGSVQFAMLMVVASLWVALVQGLGFADIRHRLGKHLAAGVGIFLNAIGILCIAYSSPGWWNGSHPGQTGLAVPHVIGIILSSTGTGLVEPALSDLVAAYINDPSQMGTAQGLANSCRNVASIAAPLIVSQMYDVYGGALTYASMVVPIVCAGLAVWGAKTFGTEVVPFQFEGDEEDEDDARGMTPR